MDWAGLGGLLVGAAAFLGLLVKVLQDRRGDRREDRHLSDEHEQALSALVTERLDIFIRGQAAAFDEVKERLLTVEEREKECRAELAATRGELERLHAIVDRRNADRRTSE